MTLAERTLRLLESVDPDRARAITKVTDAATRSALPAQEMRVRLVEVEKGVGLIVVGPSTSLRDIPWLKLVEISPTNHILVLPSGVPVEQLEVTIADLIESKSGLPSHERLLLSELRSCLSRLRREKKMCKHEIILAETRDAK